MFKEIFLFELKFNAKKISNYIYFAVLFALGLTIALFTADVFDVGQGESQLIYNSSYKISDFLLKMNTEVMALFNSIILISVMGTAIQKDYQYNFHPLIFTKPITKSAYFFGRFFAVFLVAILVFAALLIGYGIGMGIGASSPKVGPFIIGNYLYPFLIFMLPNIFLQGIIIFSLTTFLRSTLPAYLFAIILLFIGILTNNFMGNIDNLSFVALFENTGQYAFKQQTQYWAPFEMNHLSISFKDSILYNRLIWIGIAILITIISYNRFSFSQFLQPLKLFKRKVHHELAEEVYAHATLSELPKENTQSSMGSKWRKLWYLTAFELKYIVRSNFYLIIAALGIIVLFINSYYMDSFYDVATYTVTYQIVGLIEGSLSLFTVLFAVIYSGTIIWREKETKIDELVGSTPSSNHTLFISKFFGILLSLLLINAIGILIGILIQVSRGNTVIVWSQYIVYQFEFAIQMGIMLLLCMALQSMVSNKYLGFAFSIFILLIIPIALTLAKVNNQLFFFNSDGDSLPYSDMNGYGGKWLEWSFFKMYWFSFAAILGILGIVVYYRGKEKGFGNRLKLNKLIYKKWNIAGWGIFVLLFIGTGAAIYYQKYVVNETLTSKQMLKFMGDHELKYKRFEGLPQPRIVSVNVDADIYPKLKKLVVKGHFVLKNKHAQAIDTLYLEYSGGLKSNYNYTVLSPNVPFSVIEDDKKNGVKIVRLDHPMQPQDTLSIIMEMTYQPRGLFNGGESMIVGNGTFFNNFSFFTLGYNTQSELTDNKERVKLGLPEKERMAAITDTEAVKNNYISHDADWIDFESTISTDEGQIAIAPGYLMKSWNENGRAYFHYKMDSPILNFYSFMSGKYEVARDHWNDVQIEIFYDKKHAYNIASMMKSIKASLDYFTKAFGPYQHRQVRIIEFPRYASFAQSFPNTIPYSESIGFISKLENKEDAIDIPFYITAHEVAHQWWAHQVIGGDVQGSVIMSESMSQYAALMVMEKAYGQASIDKFLKYELDQYLKGRTFERKKELPFLLVENQQYIHYNKGSLVMYALKYYLGEDKLNTALSQYLQHEKFKEPPYSTALTFYEYIKNAAPDSLQYLLHDLFEEITIYDNQVVTAKSSLLPDGKYKVSMEVRVEKFYAGKDGKEEKAPIHDYIEIDITKKEKGGQDKSLLKTMVKINKETEHLEFVVDEKPDEAGIDPHYILIDKNTKNNRFKLNTSTK